MQTLIQEIVSALTNHIKLQVEKHSIQECYLDSEFMKIQLKTHSQKLNTELALIATTIIESLESIFTDQIKDVPREVLKSKAQEILSYQEMQTYINCKIQFSLIKTLFK